MRRRVTGEPAADSTVSGPNVYVFDPAMPTADVQAAADKVFAKTEANELGPERYALLFKPDRYDVTFDVGVYTQAVGLGRGPDDV